MDMVEFKKNVKGERLINKNLLKVLSVYCNNEIENLKNSELYIKFIYKLSLEGYDYLKIVSITEKGIYIRLFKLFKDNIRFAGFKN